MRLLLPLALAAILAIGCAGTSNNSSGPVDNSTTNEPGKTAKLLTQITMPIPADVYPTFKTNNQVALEAKGIQFLDDQNALLFPPHPLEGRWVHLGGKHAMADRNGVFILPENASGSEVTVTADVGSTKALFIFDPSKLAKTGSTPPEIVFPLVHKGPAIMDPSGADPNAPCCATGPSAADDGLNQGDCGRGATPTCCLDYDGPLGDGVRHPDPTDPERYSSFVGSTCFIYVLENVCLAEAAETDGLAFQGCFATHKYRFCQNLDRTHLFLVPNVRTVKPGQSINLILENNTVANETQLTLTGEGALTVDGVVGGSHTVRHYDDGARTHLVQKTVTYDAPLNLPDGVDELDVVVTATADGREAISRIKVKRDPKVETVEVDPASATLEEGRSIQLRAIGKDKDGNVVPNVTFTWTSSDSSKASVTNNGLVTAVGQGTVTITATETINGKSGTATINCGCSNNNTPNARKVGRVDNLPPCSG